MGTTGVSASVEGLTLIRTRGLLTLQLQSSAGAGNGFFGAFGICLVGIEAFTAGVASVPDPQDDVDDERWLYHTFFEVRTTGTVAAELGKDNLASFRHAVDSKAMRKEPPDLAECIVLGAVEIGTATMDWSYMSRTLVKLP